jgi:hypothetical protein
MAASPVNFESNLPWPDFRELHAHWRSKSPSGRLPGRDSIEPRQVHRLLPRIFMLDVLRSPDSPHLGFRFRLAGSEHFDINQVELTGLTIEQAFTAARLEERRSAYTQVVTSRKPLLTLKASSAVEDRDHVQYDRLLLPLASDGETVDMILGYVHRLNPPD